MTEEMETRIREALRAKALEVDVPEDLAEHTLAAARAAETPTLVERLRARRDARRMHGRVTGYPRLLYVGAAGAAAAMLFAVGLIATGIGPDPAMLGEGGTDQASRQSVTDEMGVPGPDVGITSADSAPRPAVDPEPGLAVEPGGPDMIGPPVPPSRPGTAPPRIIRSAQVSVEVDRGGFGRAWRDANEIAGRHGGFVTSSQTEQLDGAGHGSLTMRVPAANLGAAVADLRRLGEVSMETTSAQDVSGQIVDIEARLRALRAEETQLLALLERARGVPELLEVRSQLQMVRQEIESLDAQRQYYADQVDLATLHATLFEPGGAPRDGDDNILLEAWRTALRAGLTIVAGTMVVLGGLLPLALLAGGVWGVVRLIRRRPA